MLKRISAYKLREVRRVTILLAITTGVCALKWLKYYVCTQALAHIMANRKLTTSDEEIKAATAFVWRKVLHVKDQ